jgi:hypothetical protein
LASTQRPEAPRAAHCKAVALEPNSAERRWLERKAALLVTPRECSRARKVRHRSIWRTPDQDRRAPLRRLEISFSQGAEWKALISTYIGTIPLSGDACEAEQGISSAPPP